jgi:hypothetical protein
MERKKHNNPVHGGYYSERDFLIGHTLFLGGFKFQLLKADEYTEKYMEDNPDLFPQADISSIIAKVGRASIGHKSLQDFAITLLAKLDKNGNGILTVADFINGLKS